jgi:hypothetical protein
MDEQLPLFPSWPTLADSEVMAVLRSAISRGIRGSREADLYLASICARHLVDELHSAGLVVVRPSPSRLHE